MRKILSLSAALFIVVAAYPQQQQRRLDQPMQTKSCHIKIEANAFVAKTFIELEYYNPQSQEIEGLRHLRLRPGQLITAFQLELNGQYRDGSIEERRKATNAYNSIVGKRIDPALLQQTHEDNYRLNIYPFAPKSTRKVTITLVEMLKFDSNRLAYELPLTFFDSAGLLKVDINVHGRSLQPEIAGGLLAGSSFAKEKNKASLNYRAANTVVSNKEIKFFIPFKADQYQYIPQLSNGKNVFSLRFIHDLPKEHYSPARDELTVFWDVSASSNARNIAKEINFLHSYIVSNKILRVNLYSFNQQLDHIGSFDMSKQSFSTIRSKINSLSYNGTTDFNAIDFTSIKTGFAFVFSDGIQTRGKKDIVTGSCKVNFVISSKLYDEPYIQKIVDRNGGNIINLTAYKMDSLVQLASQGQNMLYEISADGKDVKTSSSLPIKEKQFLLTGEADGMLQLKFGNQLYSAGIYNLAPTAETDSLDTYETIQLITNYEKLKRSWNWYDILLFGIENKIVTAYTAFIVLERIEDYITYKIAPPKELEEQCRQMNYVYSTEYKRKEILQNSKEDMLNAQVAALNNKMKWWYKATLSGNDMAIDNKDKKSDSGSVSEVIVNSTAGSKAPFTIQQPLSGQNTIAEVVITSAFNTRRTARSVSSNVQIVNTEQLNTIRGTDLNNALAGKVAGIQVMSQSKAKLGAITNVRLRGESTFSSSPVLYVVNGTIVPSADYVNMDDIDNVTVLQGPNAAALFGPEGANGAIVMTLKKAKRMYYDYNIHGYKIANDPPADYINDIRLAGKDMFLTKYLDLKKYQLYENDASFYFEVSRLFYEYGLKEDAFKILEDGIEMTNGSESGIRAAAYIFESWGEYAKAIGLYKNIIDNRPAYLGVIRDLGLCYFRNGQYQLALDTYYHGLTLPLGIAEDSQTKSLVINEINALVAVHGDQLDLSGVDTGIIKHYPADMYISIENNTDKISHFSVLPSGKVWTNSLSLNSNFYHTNTYTSSNNEVLVYKSPKGKYRIVENIYNYYAVGPQYHRIISFKNFQQPDQKIEVQTIKVERLYGSYEIGTVSW